MNPAQIQMLLFAKFKKSDIHILCGNNDKIQLLTSKQGSD